MLGERHSAQHKQTRKEKTRRPHGNARKRNGGHFQRLDGIYRTNRRRRRKLKGAELMQIITGESMAEQLNAWNIPCAFSCLTIAPQLIKYNFILKDFTKLQKAKRLAENLTAWSGQAATINTTAGGFAVELARTKRQFISLNEYADTLEKAEPFSLALGTNTNGEHITATLEDLTHLLIAGTTGGGKSVILNNIIISLTAYNTPDRLALFLIDAKKVEFKKFEKLPHLRGGIISEPEQAKQIFLNLIDIMQTRYKKLEQIKREKAGALFKKIVVIVDELTDLIQQDASIKPLLARLLQKSRAAGIHFILATQSPRANILDGVTLANLPSRLALKCASVRESVLILGHGGAEKLNGKGDAIFKPQNTTNETRIQAPHITAEQIKNIIN